MIKNILRYLRHKFTSMGEKLLSYTLIFPRILCYIYREKVNEELKGLHLTNDDRVMIIGGGSTPYTAILINRLTGAVVDVLDKDAGAVRRSKRLLNRLGLDEKIKPIKGDGLDFDFSPYSMVFLSRQAEPGEELVYNVLDKCQKGTKIFARKKSSTMNSIKIIKSGYKDAVEINRKYLAGVNIKESWSIEKQAGSG